MKKLYNPTTGKKENVLPGQDKRIDFMNNYKGRASLRSERTTGLDINLTATDPLERLEEFCKQGKYEFAFGWDKFNSGVMCELSIFYELCNNRATDIVIPATRKLLIKEVRYVKTIDPDSVNYAKKVTAAILLERLGLSPLEAPLENEDQLPEKMEEQSPVDIVTESIQNLIKENTNFLADSSPLENMSMITDFFRDMFRPEGDGGDPKGSEESLDESLENTNTVDLTVETNFPLDKELEEQKPRVYNYIGPKREPKAKTWAEVAKMP